MNSDIFSMITLTLLFIGFVIITGFALIPYAKEQSYQQGVNDTLSFCNPPINEPPIIENNNYSIDDMFYLGTNPLPKEWGITCKDNYTTKLNSSFIGCVLK